ncbi:MAG: Cytochrome c oxidase subunit [Actinomycetota bacterium]|jgi:heme/copper-type cytochrome/quinol oxidase subunit 3|nr:Cytochrome c oxidase subunit [Actinomycetota bacterium]
MTAVTVTEPIPHHEDPITIGRRWRAGVILLIVADAAFVGSLVFSYFYLRGLNTSGAWMAKHGSGAPIWFPWFIALIVVLSAGAYRWGQVGIHAGRVSRLPVGAGIAVLLLAVDIVVQVIQLGSLPFALKDSSYTSSVYVLGGANLFHLLVTFFIGLGLWNRSRLNLYTTTEDWQVRVVGIWWNWIAIAAIVSAIPTSFIASPNHLTG